MPAGVARPRGVTPPRLIGNVEIRETAAVRTTAAHLDPKVISDSFRLSGIDIRNLETDVKDAFALLVQQAPPEAILLRGLQSPGR
jgi:hypothetical protein